MHMSKLPNAQATNNIKCKRTWWSYKFLSFVRFSYLLSTLFFKTNSSAVLINGFLICHGLKGFVHIIGTFGFMLASKWRHSCWTRFCLWSKFLPHCGHLKGLIYDNLLISWTRDICSLTDFAQERTFSHKLQPKDFSSLCFLWCNLSCFGVRKVLSHNLHLWFLIPVWILMCFDKSDLSMKDFIQWTQDSDFTPRWTLMWRLNEVLCLLHLVAHFATDASGQICNQCKWPNSQLI